MPKPKTAKRPAPPAKPRVADLPTIVVRTEQAVIDALDARVEAMNQGTPGARFSRSSVAELLLRSALEAEISGRAAMDAVTAAENA